MKIKVSLLDHMLNTHWHINLSADLVDNFSGIQVYDYPKKRNINVQAWNVWAHMTKDISMCIQATHGT